MSLLDGSRSSVMIYGVSGYENVSMGNMSAQALGLADGQGNSTLDLTNDDAIQESLKAVGGALEFVEDVNDNLQATLSGGDILSYSLEEAVNEGVYLNGLEYREANYTTMAENTQAAESTINDADMAKHSVNLNLQKIQQQVAVEVSKIFKHSQSSVLELLR
jgi:flagellin-like hook-associated protein FlgL